MEMTPQRWKNTSGFLADVFGHIKGPDGDAQLATLMDRAVKAGLPDIAVSPDVGRLLKMLTMMVTSDATSRGRVIEVGTLAGYSGIWISRGLSYGGRLFTIEAEDKHAEFARNEFEAAGVLGTVQLIPGRGLDVLPRLADEMGPQSIDMAFIDAVKTEYLDYTRYLKPMLRTGGLLVADNALGSGNWWIDDPKGSNDSRDAMEEFCRAIAADPDFESACVPIREGVLMALKVR